MLIEVDGLNHTGKTTLVAALAQKGILTHKFQRTEQDPIEQMIHHHIPMAASPKLWVIDRGHGSEWCMSTALNREVPYTQLAFWALDENLAQHDTVIAYLWAPRDVIEKRLADTGREWEANYLFLMSAWEVFLATTLCRVVRLDGTLTPTDLVDQFEHQVLSLFKEDRVNGCT